MKFPLLSGFNKWSPARESRLRTGWTLGTEKCYVAELPIVIRKKMKITSFKHNLTFFTFLPSFLLFFSLLSFSW
ncbi:hypothetical protein BDV39DRAFT_44868 [Aspergillus sergii]|uniref:Uncharacterized protein n=1 Tax=Aspergillus sergii TaxID=1034303 RepID=A0A5N6XBN4_9EURO|nr:hypothetical protein BDV39DRAFT_44868 [Aspergillus sergii]